MEKTRKKRHPLLTVLLVILLLPIALLLLAVLYLFTLGFSSDDPEKMLAAEPMTAEERYTFMENADVFDGRLDKTDLWFIAEQHGVAAALEDPSLLKDYPISLEGVGIELSKDGIGINLQGKAFEFLPVPLQARATLAFDNGSLTLTVGKLRLGKLISLDAEKLFDKLGLDKKLLTYTIDAKDDELLKSVEAISAEDGELHVTCRIDELLWKEAAENEGDYQTLQEYLYFFEDVPEISLPLEAREMAETAGVDALRELQKRWAADADSFVDFRIFVLALGHENIISSRMRGSTGMYWTRFLPGLTLERIAQKRETLSKTKEHISTFLRDVAAELYDAQVAGKIMIGEHGLLDAVTGEKLSVKALMGDRWLAEDWLREADFVPLLMYNVDDRVRQYRLPIGTKMPFENDKAKEFLLRNTLYVAAYLTETPSGIPILVYYPNKNVFAMREISMLDYTFALEKDGTVFYDFSQGNNCATFFS